MLKIGAIIVIGLFVTMSLCGCTIRERETEELTIEIRGYFQGWYIEDDDPIIIDDVEYEVYTTKDERDYLNNLIGHNIVMEVYVLTPRSDYPYEYKKAYIINE